MKALLFYEVGQPLVVEEIPSPRPAHGEVLLKVKACGICGSDIHIAYEGITPTAFRPIILGHEFSGEVVDVGEGVDSWKEGDRVAASCIVSCGTCLHCLSGHQEICLHRRLLGVQLNGGLAEFVSVPAKNLISLPDTLSYEEGAILTDAVATPYHAITRRGKLVPGESVAVIGCGGLGIHAVQLSRIFGAGVVIGVDISNVALDRAKARGADLVCRSDREDPVAFIQEATGGLGADLTIECVGRQYTIAMAVASLRAGGRAVVVGLGSEEITTLAPTEFVRREVGLLGSYAFTVKEIAELVQLVQNGRLDISQSVSKTIALHEVNEGLEALHKKIDDPIRIVVTM
ncbi:MAG: zinc-binding dehydrogenase [Deltaproteobacteria bacterium]|nr:zinc-binding dehydrogenase [Deltaproteobacteria bacterium]